MKPAVVAFEKERKMTSFKKDRILFAEDHPGLLRMVSGFLRDKGYLVTAVSNGSQAYQNLLVNHYDIVILDVNMPVMGGVEAVKAIRQQNPNNYILLISGEAGSFEIDEGMRLGANGFLPKPFSLEKLLEMIAGIDLDSRERQKSRNARMEKNGGRVAKSWLNRITDLVHASLMF